MTKLPPKRPRGRPKKQETEDLRGAILDGAIRLFAEKGFENVYMKDIAAGTGVATSLLHHHFGNKEGLRTACRNYVIAQIRETLAHYDGLVPDDASLDLLEVYGSTLRSGLGGRTHLLRFLAATFMENHTDSNSLFRDYFNLFHKITLRYVAAGKLRDDVDPQWLTTQVIYMQLGTAFLFDQMRHQLAADPYDAKISQARTSAFVEIAKSGVLPEPGSR